MSQGFFMLVVNFQRFGKFSFPLPSEHNRVSFHCTYSDEIEAFCVLYLEVSASNPPFPLNDGDSRVAISRRQNPVCHREFCSWYSRGGCRPHGSKEMGRESLLEDSLLQFL